MKSDKKYLYDWREDWLMAKDFLEAAEANFRLNDFRTAANRIYFTAESAVVAALKFNSKPVSKNHKNIWMLSNLLGLGINTHELLRDLYDMRLQADYGYVSNMVKLDKDNIDRYLSNVRDLLKEIKNKFKLK